ncbi:hypothetical protein EAH81_10145 [Flavobacterium pectinovorum]|uniref:Uncharacterized protein n=1 Tax=Flavobacterium pectinovorum TaxID=29533 RepID=A0A502EX16_9FLAO|nr:hypothetical protein EAH81_10145 [Flavobacterium pectinovorum]
MIVSQSYQNLIKVTNELIKHYEKMLENFKAVFVGLGDSEMLLWNADLTDSLRENADKNRFFYYFFDRLSVPRRRAMSLS